MTVSELGDRMSSRELSAKWRAFYQIEPFGDERADLRQTMTTSRCTTAFRRRPSIRNGRNRGLYAVQWQSDTTEYRDQRRLMACGYRIADRQSSPGSWEVLRNGHDSRTDGQTLDGRWSVPTESFVARKLDSFRASHSGVGAPTHRRSDPPIVRCQRRGGQVGLRHWSRRSVRPRFCGVTAPTPCWHGRKAPTVQWV